MAVKILGLGAASMNFAGMFGDIILNGRVGGGELALYDIDPERTALMAEWVKEMASLAGVSVKVVQARSLAEGADGASFAVSDIGGVGGGGGGFHKVGGLHMNDMLISARYGIRQIVGDTAGPAAMMAAFRSVPIYLEICRELEKRAPDAVLINHANPMAVLCRALNKYTGVKSVIGICHGVQGGVRYAAEVLGVDPAELDALWIGTNHYYWFTQLLHRGRDVYPELRRKMAARTPPDNYRMHADLSDIFGYQIVYPDDSHLLEFYPFLAQAAAAAKLPYATGDSHHGRVVRRMYRARKAGGTGGTKAPSRADILRDYRKGIAWYGEWYREKLAERGSRAAKRPGEDAVAAVERQMAFFESVGTLIADIRDGLRRVHIVNVPNCGAVPNLPAEAVLEVEGVSGPRGMRPVFMGGAPVALKGQLEKIIAWQELTADAAVKGGRNLALQALMLDPMAVAPDRARTMLDELMANSRAFLPQFRARAGGRR